MAGQPATREIVPAKRATLHDEIVVRLRDLILDGALAPGEWIAEMKLCRDLAISRTPLREALKVLASENLVTLLPNRGAMVTEIVADEIAELFEMMGALEELIGRLAVERAADGEVAALQGMHKQMVKQHRAGQRHAYFDTNQAIHRRIAELSGNRSLLRTYVGFADKIRRARYLANLSDARWAESVQEHEAFMEALARRDAAVFAALLREHSNRTGEVVCAAIQAKSGQHGAGAG